MDDEAAILAELKTSMAEIDEHDAGLPLPDDQHSVYAHLGELVRHQMDDLGWPQFTVGTSELLRESDKRLTGVSPPELATYTLAVGLVGGLAPYVGRPFHYEWRYAQDHHHRWVGGTAFIVYDEEEFHASA